MGRGPGPSLGKEGTMDKGAAILAALLLTACGWNPTEGDFGPVEVVPERELCWVTVRETDSTGRRTRIYTEQQPCDGDEHHVEIFDRRWP